MKRRDLTREILRGPVCSVQVISADDLATLNPPEKCVVFSIASCANYHPEVPKYKYGRCLYRDNFDDATEGNGVLLKIQAEGIAFLTRAALHCNTNLFICQCEAGMSRSAGLAQAIYEHFNGPSDWFEENYEPNTHVRDLVATALKGKVK